jgi:glycerol-3-phosphate dehydrogenase
MQQRADLLNRLRAGDCPDILIIGGGINGAGVFRDLAAQDVSSLLVEAGDFSSGTSAAPSRLIHGGLRYLETGETALVRESLIERNLLLKNARHVVQPQPVWVPVRSWFAGAFSAALRFFRLKRTPGAKGLVPLALGLRVYDLFGRTHRTMPTHRIIGATRARREMPALADDIKAVAEFYDARISHPERLVLELIEDAENECPEAMAIPYLKVDGTDGGKIRLRDMLEDETFEITPKLVVNAAGAWVDRVQNALGIDGRLMGGTRGTHLVMRNADLVRNLGGRMLYFETHDHRACLALPLDDRHVYVGTTDVRTDDPEDRHFSQAEIDYILDVLRPVLPRIDWRLEDSVFTMAGVRPLPFQDDRVRSTGAISRDHRIDAFPAKNARPFETLTLVGGKWTTYRAFAEEVADRVMAATGATRRTSTENLPIGGARGLPETAEARSAWIDDLAARTGLSAARCRLLTDRYGAGAAAVAEAEAGDNRAFAAVADYTPAEIARICRNERVSRLEDVVLRRTLMAFEGETSRAALSELADLVAATLGWTDARRDAELARTTETLRAHHRVAVT